MYEYGVTGNPLLIREHGGIFDRVVVAPEIRGGTTVTYWLDTQRFTVPGPYSFYLEWAEHPDADFVQVAGPTQENYLVDAVQRRFSKLPHSCYRVRVETPSGDYYSSPNLALGDWNRHDYLLARDIIRREYLRIQRYAGTRGVYLARMQWGEFCTRCIDYNTNMPTDSNCPTCYGTGFVGGYHTPSEFWMEEDRVPVRARREESIGVRADQVQTARAIACPFLTAKDVWVSGKTGERWSIEAKRELAALRGTPLVFAVELRLIEPSSVIYDLSLEAAESSSA